MHANFRFGRRHHSPCARLLAALLAILAILLAQPARAAPDSPLDVLLAAARAGDETEVQRLRAQFDAAPKPARGDRKTARALNDAGIRRLKDGDGAAAVDQFAKAAAADPGDVEVLGNLGYALVQTGRAAGALAVFERAVALAPSRSATWGNIGEANAAVGSESNAVAAFRLAYLLSRNRDRTIAYLDQLISEPQSSRALISAARTARDAPALAATTRPRAAPSAPAQDRRGAGARSSINVAVDTLNSRFVGDCTEDDQGAAAFDPISVTSTESLPWNGSDYVLIHYTGFCGGNYSATELFKVANGKAELIKEAKMEDYGFLPGPRRVRVDNGKMILQGGMWREDDPHCCPSLTATMSVDLATYETAISNIRHKKTNRPYKGPTTRH